MTKKEKLITFGIGLGVILLCPFPTRIAQSLQLEFSGKDLRPLTGMRVSQSWETYGLFGSRQNLCHASRHGVSPTYDRHQALAAPALGLKA